MMAPTPRRKKPLVLIVDDDMTQRVLMEETLSDAGYDIEQAENGTDGVAIVRSLRPDLLILDVVMPDMDGFEVCKTLRQDAETAYIPIMMVTGLDDEASIGKAFEYGATQFLAKPINWTLLGHHVKYLLRSSRIERRLRRAKIAADSANRAKTEFLANMTHELRTPLNAIIGFADLTVNQSLGPVDDVYLECARDIRDAGAHLLALINDILDLSKIEVGKAEIDEALVAVAEVVDSSLRVVKQRAGEAGLAVETHVAATLPPLIADERKLKQMLLNLLSNAIKFTPQGGQVRVSVHLADHGDLLIEVQDTGIGIAPDKIPLALEAFRQVEAGRDRSYGGTGLGLSLTKSLVELHGGTLELRSALGAGTTAVLRFPASRAAAGQRKTG